MTDKERDEELIEYEGKLLPRREVMSLLSTGSAPVSTAGMETLAAQAAGADPTAGGAGTASGAAGAADDLVDAEASGRGEESVTDEDRSETISQSDSAYAGP